MRGRIFLIPRSHDKQNESHIAVRRLQYRYGNTLATLGVVLTFMTAGLTLYLLNHNYRQFANAELLKAPKMVDHLYRELKLANEILVITFLGFIGFMWIWGTRISRRIIVPVFQVKEKMDKIIEGKLFEADVKNRPWHEFQELSDAHNDMVRYLREQLQRDISHLQELNPGDGNRHALHIWKQMLSEKTLQLSGESVSTDPSDVSRHAS